MAKNNELCTNVICPDNYYESSDGKCEKCPKGCKDCLMDDYNNIKCTTCIEGYNLEISEQKCKEDACIYFAVIAGVTKCFSDKCPDESVFLERNKIVTDLPPPVLALWFTPTTLPLFSVASSASFLQLTSIPLWNCVLL